MFSHGITEKTPRSSFSKVSVAIVGSVRLDIDIEDIEGIDQRMKFVSRLTTIANAGTPGHPYVEAQSPTYALYLVMPMHGSDQTYATVESIANIIAKDYPELDGCSSYIYPESHTNIGKAIIEIPYDIYIMYKLGAAE